MIEMTCDLWTTPADARCVTTNGATRRDGHAVMGRGTALQAAQRYEGLAVYFGRLLRERGNRVHVLLQAMATYPKEVELTEYLVSFPVKHHWREQADLDLIARSAHELVALADKHSMCRILLPRPGCGNGQRDWETEVKPILSPILDSRFVVVTQP
jgi:hypothetical protein